MNKYLNAAFLLLVVALLSACSWMPVHSEGSIKTLSTHSSTSTAKQLGAAPLQVSQSSVTELQAPAPLRIQHAAKRLDPKEVECVAKVVFHEARGEGEKGMVAVAHVVLNRMKDSRFPDTACGVVKESRVVKKNGTAKRFYQFSWVGKENPIRDKKSYARAQEIAEQVLTGEARNPVGKSLFFHASYVKPQKKHYAFRLRIGNHVFYT